MSSRFEAEAPGQEQHIGKAHRQFSSPQASWVFHAAAAVLVLVTHTNLHSTLNVSKVYPSWAGQGSFQVPSATHCQACWMAHHAVAQHQLRPCLHDVLCSMVQSPAFVHTRADISLCGCYCFKNIQAEPSRFARPPKNHYIFLSQQM